jgi:aminoglycoside phosphotransferase
MIDRLLQELKDNFLKTRRYVFTNGDLNLSNIIVSDDKIGGIIDWERVGYMPDWAELFLARQVMDWYNYDFYEMVAKELYEEFIAIGEFYKKGEEPVLRAYNAYIACPVEHTGDGILWHRELFCKC